jgi:hypothetical protein
LKQEWEKIEACAPTKTHFLKLPQEGVGISGTMITEGEKSLFPLEYSLAPEGPAPATEHTPAKEPESVAAVKPPTPVPAPTPKDPTEIHHVSFKKCDCDDAAALLAGGAGAIVAGATGGNIARNPPPVAVTPPEPVPAPVVVPPTPEPKPEVVPVVLKVP